MSATAACTNAARRVGPSSGRPDARIRRLLATVLLAALACVAPSPAPADTIDDGIAWLTTNQVVDGSWGGEASSPATIFQSTSEALETLSFQPTQPFYADGLNWIATEPVVSVDHQARALFALATGGSPSSTVRANMLAAAQNADGGFGIEAGFASDVLDTSLALRALVRAGHGDTVALSDAAVYLLNAANGDGGVGLAPGDASTVYDTALYLLALREYQVGVGGPGSVAAAVAAACAFLDGAQRGDGGWGAAASTVFESGLVTYAMARASCAFGNLVGAVGYLEAQYSATTWNDNAYEVALATRALALTARPNLAFATAGITFDPTLPIQGESITVSVTVDNVGIIDTPAVVVRFFDGDPQAGGTPIGADQTLAISAGGNATAQVSVSFADLGPREVFAVVDPDGAVSESNEADNSAQATLQVVITAPDLTVDTGDIQFTPPAPAQNESFQVQATVHNTGRVDAANVVVRFYEGDPGAGGTPIGSDQIIAGIAVGASGVASLSHSLLPPGDQAIHVRVDPDDAIVEQFEDNNDAANTVSVAPVPDLRIEAGDIAFTPASALQGEAVTITATVHNIGGLDAGAFKVRAYAGDPGAGGQPIVDWTLNGLAAGASFTFDWDQWIPPASGDFDVHVVVDVDAQVSEIFEDNNAAFATVSVAPLPDVSVATSDVTVDPDFPKPGESFDITVAVRNPGDGDASDVLVRVYDGDPAAGGTLIGEQTIATLAAGAVQPLVFPYLRTVDGQFKLHVHSDPGDTISEVSEANNNAVRSVLVSDTVLLQPSDPYVATISDDSRLYVAGSNGDGTFSALQFVEDFGTNSRGVVIGDFNGDGDFDVVTGYGSNPTMHLFYLERDGSGFETPVYLGPFGDSATSAGSYPEDMAAEDFNNDGDMDFVAGGDSNYTWYFQNNGAGLVTTPENFFASDFETGDEGWGGPLTRTAFERDDSTAASGAWSMRVFATDTPTALSIDINPSNWFLSYGSTLRFDYRIPAGVPVGMLFNVSGYGWIWLGGSPAADPGIYPASPQAVTLTADDTWHSIEINVHQAIRALWPDASLVTEFEWWTNDNATAGQQFWFDDFRITRPRMVSGFDVTVLPSTGGNGRGMDAADVDNDGDMDFARARTSGGYIYLYSGDGNGGFTPSASQVADPGSDPYGVLLGDFDNDGFADLIGNSSSSGNPTLFAGNGDGTFQGGVYVGSLDTNNYTSLGKYDFDGDGNLDAVAATYSSRQLWFYPGLGDGTFGPPTLIGSTTSPAVNILAVAAPAGRVPGQPYAIATSDAALVNENVTVSFDGSNSFDDGSIVSYQWDFGDGATASGATPSHAFPTEGVYKVLLTVTDDQGLTDRAAVRLLVFGDPPVAVPGDYAQDEHDALRGRWQVALDGSASSDSDTAIVLYQWDFDASDGVGVDATGVSPVATYTAAGVYTVTLTVTDEVGLSGTATGTVTIAAGAAPSASFDGPALLDESDASLGEWTGWYSAAGSSDAEGIASYTVDWGDGTSSTLAPLADGFDDGDFTADPAWNVSGGSWSVVDGEVQQTSTGNAWYFLQDLNRSYRDFEIELDVMGVDTGSNDGYIGIAFRNANAAGSQDSLLLYSRNSWDYWRFYDWRTDTTLQDGGTGWDEGTWYHLRIRVVGDTMALYVTPEGGVETLQIETTRAGFPSGGIGLLANAQSLRYDNVKVTPLDDDWSQNGQTPADLVHAFDAADSRDVTLTVSDHAGQTDTATVTTTTAQGDPPQVDTGGPYVLGEADAFNGLWDLVLQGSGSDDTGVQRYEIDFGDGTTYTTGSADGTRARYFAAGTDLYGFDTAGANLQRIIATEDDTLIEIVDLDTGAVITSATRQRLQSWNSVSPGDGVFYKVRANKPVVAYFTDLAEHAAFAPSLDGDPVGREFVLHYDENGGFFVYAVEDAQVTFFDTNDAVVRSFVLRAGDYEQVSGLSQTTYRVVASGRIAMQTVGDNSYTTVPSASGDGAGQLFYFATHLWQTGAFTVFAHAAADVEVFDMDTGASLYTRSMAAGEMWFEAGVGSRRLRLESTADVEVWAGDTEGGNAILNLGDDVSFAGGRGGTEFVLHELVDGIVIFAPSDDTEITVDAGEPDAIVTTLQRDEFLHLTPAELPVALDVHRITASRPVVVQTLGRASAFNDLGTWLGGVTARHRYGALGTYDLTLTAIDHTGQRSSATTTVDVTQGDPPVAAIDAPAAVDEGAATGGGWRVDFDASGSTDDTEIIAYQWDFGDGGTASGIATTHVYDMPGTYTVTLTVTDPSGQTGTTTFDVTVQANAGPVADAGGPYVFGETAASRGVWTASLDATGSTDDFAIFDYLWTVPGVLVDDFTGTVIDSAKWTPSDGVAQDGAATVTGTGSWGNRYLRGTKAVERGLVFQARLTTDASGTQRSMWGLRGASSSNSYTAMPYAIYFNQTSVQIYEDGSFRSTVGSFTLGVAYDVRITVNPGAGATYELKRADESDWTVLYVSGHSTESPLSVHGTVLNGATTVDDVQVDALLTGPTPSIEFDQPGVRSVTLRVRDNALQESVDTTTITLETGAPPVADAGGPYTVEVGSMNLFNGTGSSDDVNIESYQWVFGDSTGGPSDLPYTGQGASATHFYQAVGTYDLALTVFDNAGQSHTDTTTVEVIVGSPPVANMALPTNTAAGGPPAYFDARASLDDYGIVEYRWDFDDRIDRDGDGDFSNDIDAVGPRPFHTYSTATGLFFEEPFDGNVLDTDAWIAAGATQDEAVTVVGANSWGSRYLFSNAAMSRAASYRATITPLNPSGSQTAMIGLKTTSTSYSYTQMPHAIYFDNGTIRVYEQGSYRGLFGSYTRGQTYEVRIDVNEGAGATYFIREAGAATWTTLYSSTNRSDAPLRLGITVNAGEFVVDDFTGMGPDPYRVTLTVEDGAGQTDTVSTTVPVVLNLPPDVITVPWVARDPVVPHETFNGRSIRLKGIVRDADPVSYQWDFGDGTQSPVTAVSDPYDLSVAHTYPDAPSGTPFTAVLTVWDSAGQAGQDTYNVIVRPETLNTEINVAIDEGLWYLHQQQNRTTSAGYPSSYWAYSSYESSPTSSALQAFQINGHLETGDHSENPYAETVDRGMKFLFTRLASQAIGTQTYGEPDTNGNGLGITVTESRPIYEGGPVMDAIASSGTPLARAVTGGADVARRSYFDILTDMADQFAWGQYDSGSNRGGWRYSWNQGPDNSAAQWGAIGLLAAEEIFGIPVPPFVKEQNLIWLDYSYNGTGYGYTSAGNDRESTPSGLVQLAFDDVSPDDPRWRTAEDWIADNWDTGSNWVLMGDPNKSVYGMFAFAKAMRLATPEPIVNLRATGLDWYNDPVRGIARLLVDDQQADGLFPGSVWVSGPLRSAWGVIILSQSLFVQPPVADAGRDRAWAVDEPLPFDGSGSFHLDPFRNIVKYEWDFDGDGSFDVATTDPVVEHTYSSADYPISMLPRTFTVTLRVSDDQTPALTDTDTVNIIVAEPPHPPVAEAGGPYTCTAGLSCQLDGSGSFDIDPFDKIVRWEWELDSQFPFDFDEASGEMPLVVFDSPGVFDIGLRVWDDGQFNDLDNDGEVDEDERLSDQHFVKVTVEENLAPVADANGPYTVNEGSTINLDATGSSDPNDDPLTYEWDFDSDGNYDDATGATPPFTGIDDGTVPVAARVTDGLLTDVATATVTVVNVPPAVDAGPDQTPFEGATVLFDGAFTDPGTLDTHTIEWDFGDGSAPATGTLTPTHVYPDNGAFVVTLTVTDDDGGVGTDTLSVVVGNAIPDVDAGPDATIDEGDTFSSAGSFTDPGSDTWTATVDYGDGAGPQPLTLAPDGSFVLNNTYPDDGVFDVTVRVTDDDGGVGSDTVVVTVNNVAPDVDAGPDATLDEGDTFSSAGSFTDPGADTWSATVDYGDGAGPQPLTLNPDGTFPLEHTYADDGVYTVTVTVTDDDGGVGSDTALVTVGNVAPVVDAGPDAAIDEGDTFTGSGSFTDPGADTWTATVDYGDGAGPQPLALNPDKTFALSHMYPADGVYTVTVTVTDDEGGVGSDTLTVIVATASLTVDAGIGRTVNEGQTTNFTGSFSNPNPSPSHTIQWDFGDGNGTTGTLMPSHVYADDGVYTVRLTVTDADGDFGTDTLTMTVNNVPPVVEAGANQDNVPPGTPIALDPATFTDAGVDDTHTATVDWGDGTVEPGALTQGAGSGTVDGSHGYAAPGTYTVTVTVTDDDGGVGIDTFTVGIVDTTNTLPVVDAGPGATLDEGDTFTGAGSFTDPDAEPWTASVDYGDGSGPQPLALNPDKTFALGHTYTDDGTYTVTVTVTDDEGGSASDTTLVTVNNVAPLVDAGPDATLDEGDTFSSAGSFIDPGADTWTASVDYGDGAGPQPLALNPDKTFALGHTYADDGVYTVTVTVTDDDGGVGSDTALVTVGNVAPVVDVGPDAAIDEGGTFTRSGSFTDPGADTWTASVDYGDGSGPQPLALNPDKTFDLSQVYPVDGVYTVTVTVTDDEGASGSDALVLTVNDSPPPTGSIDDLYARAKSGKVDLVWTPVAGADSYNVYRSTTPGGPYDLIATGYLCTYCAYVDAGLTNNVTYYYVVTFVTAGGESVHSNEASARPAARTRGR